MRRTQGQHALWHVARQQIDTAPSEGDKKMSPLVERTRCQNLESGVFSEPDKDHLPDMFSTLEEIFVYKNTQK